MLFNSLILLLLSNSITSRRDKSILYSRNTITILMVSACTAYYNLSNLFLAKGIGIFGGLFHITALLYANSGTTNLDSLYIITSIIYIVSLIQCFTFVELLSPHSFYSSCYLSGFSGDKEKGKAKNNYKQNTDE